MTLHSLQSHFTVSTPLNHHNEAQKGSMACPSSHSQSNLATIQIHLQHLTHVLTPRPAPRTSLLGLLGRLSAGQKTSAATWTPGKFCQVWLLRVLEAAMQVGWA